VPPSNRQSAIDNRQSSVLFVEPFYGGSHRAFLDGLVRHSRHDFTLLTLPDGEWRQRMRRGAQELAAQARAIERNFDLLVVSDMLDLPAFLALTRPRFAHTPVLAYFHENQFTYPRIRGTKFNSWFGQINYLTALAADAVAFNSEFHRQDFLGALRSLAGQPNNWLVPESIHAIEKKSFVLSVGVELDWLDVHKLLRDPAKPPLVLWNHRWEFDKSPELFARVIRRLATEEVPFALALAGEPGLNPSPALADLARGLPERIRHFGFVADRDDYARLLWESDVVVSTTRHEFFGVAMVEAMYAGCVPLAPRNFNYPALVPPELHETCLFDDEDALAGRLRSLLAARPSGASELVRASATRFAWAQVAPVWDAALGRLASRESATCPNDAAVTL
jgi:glycosyltransferase involved in cell wall biosynthesis